MKKEFKCNFNSSNQCIFIYDGNKRYIIDLCKGTCLKGTRKYTEITGLILGLDGTKTLFAKRLEKEEVISTINDFEARGIKIIPIKDIVSKLINVKSTKMKSGDEVKDVIEKLKRKGELFEPREGFISRI